ncbi:MAG: hypothetical protein DRJ31_00785 [Candidatus Methanomethylicota archaeon]|uniref:Pyridine nucleotide-disulfide oxidoreductase n=1 Tax=Thermoproteota archaeon TaxID=2056631 RepID=A0A497EU82_9CREN|nr:MAG: hypothetical protein DRJ31_00785 [Candidatus Verstraetearchaeota archaeon]
MERLLIIGGGVAGCTAALYARRINKNVDITIVEKSPYPAYSRCGLPYLISGKVRSHTELLEYPPEFYNRVIKARLMLLSEAIELDCSRQLVKIRSKDGGVTSLEYDSLIIATGAEPLLPSFVHDRERVFTLRSIEDALAMKQFAHKSKRVIIIGGGFIGLELAEAFHDLGLDVSIVEMRDQLLPQYLDFDMAKIIERHLLRRGIKLFLGKAVEEVTSVENGVRVVAGDEVFRCDFAVLCIGVSGNVKLAKDSHLKLGSTGLIKVDEHMKTSEEGVYAAGDCVECWDPIYRQPLTLQLGSVAVRQAMVAGINAAGGDMKINGFTGAMVIKVFDLEIACAGLPSHLARKQGVNVQSIRVLSKDKIHYFKGCDVFMKLIVDQEGRIVGGQAVGNNASKYIDLVSLAMLKRMKVEELALIETCYSPVVSSAWVPPAVAAQAFMFKTSPQ